MARVLVTGANRGIGLELARQFAARGDEVIAACRSSGEDLDALGVRVHEGLDVTDDASVEALARDLGSTRLDILVNNAGILMRQPLEDLDFDGMRRQFEVNTLGPLRVTRALLDCLGDGSKVAIVSSRMGSIADNGSGGGYGYRVSKAGVNMIGKSLSIDLAPRGIAVILLHPGMVSTRMIDFQGQVTPEQAAAGLIARIDELSPETTGAFRHANGETLPW